VGSAHLLPAANEGYNFLMPQYRRARIPGGTYFFTVVTYHRQPVLTDLRYRTILDAVIQGSNAILVE